MDAQPPRETMRRRRNRERPWPSLVALLATLVGLSIAVFVMRPEDEPVGSNVYDGAISPGTDARVRIDVRPVGGSDFFEEVQTTARLVSLDPKLEKRLTAVGKCGISIEIASGWSRAGSKDDASMEVSPSFFGGTEIGPGCGGMAVGRVSADSTEPVPPFIKTLHYWYPFDRLTYRVRATIRIFRFKADGGPGDYGDWRFATPELHFSAPGWRVRQRESLVSPVQTVISQPGSLPVTRWQPGAAVVEAELTRPLAVQLSVVLFLLVLLLAVASISQVETLADSLQMAIAVSVLLWTSREALVPGAPKLFLAVDAIFLGLALLVLGTTLTVSWRHGGKPRGRQEATAPTGAECPLPPPPDSKG